MTSPDDDELSRMGAVDVDPRVHKATEEDEEQILTSLYGQPDEHGVFRGES